MAIDYTALIRANEVKLQRQLAAAELTREVIENLKQMKEFEFKKAK